jgi:hypothetical protein
MTDKPRTDVITAAPVPGGTAVAVAVHDPAMRSINVYCSACAHNPYTVLFGRGDTVADIAHSKARAAEYTTRHAAACSTTDALDRS